MDRRSAPRRPRTTGARKAAEVELVNSDRALLDELKALDLLEKPGARESPIVFYGRK